MDHGSVTWIVTADTEGARIFCERARTGSLQERLDLRRRLREARARSWA